MDNMEVALIELKYLLEHNDDIDNADYTHPLNIAIKCIEWCIEHNFNKIV